MSKYCIKCNKLLPISYQDNTCIDCIKEETFQKVKEYIMNNNVTEFDVAKEFNIPLRWVSEWIKKDRIQYRVQENKITFDDLISITHKKN